MDLAKMIVKLELQTQQYVAELDRANKKLDQFSRQTSTSLSGLNKVTAKVGASIKGMLAGITIAATVRKFVTETSEGEKAAAKLDNVLRLTGATAGITRADVAALAAELGHSAKVSNTATEAAASLMLQYDGMSRETFPRAMRAAADLAAMMDSDLPSAARAVGMALERAAQGETDFRLEGVKLTDAQKYLIEKFGKAGDAATAQKVVLQALETQVGGTAEAIGNTMAGSVQGLKNAWDDLFQLDVERNLDDTKGAIDRLTEAVGNPKLKEYIGDLIGLFADVGATLVEQGSEYVTFEKKLFGSLGRIGSAVKEAAHGEFAKSWEELRKVMRFEDDDAIASKGHGDIGRRPANEPDLSGKGIKVPDPALLSKIKSTAEALANMDKALKQQIATFGQGDAAAIRYRLTLGDLKDEVELLGKKGIELRDKIISDAVALENKQNAKEITDALKTIRASVAELQGDTVSAELIRFDADNLELRDKMTKQGNADGLKWLDTLRELTKAQAQYNELSKESSVITDELAAKEERIRANLEAGAISEVDAQDELAAVRTQAVAQLEAIRKEMEAIAQASGNPDMVANVKQFGNSIDELGNSIKSAGDILLSKFREDFENTFADFISGSASASDAFKAFANDVIREMSRISARSLTQAIFGGGKSGSGGFLASLGSLFSSVASAFGGGGATSASVNAGTQLTDLGGGGGVRFAAKGGRVDGPTVVGEHGAELMIPERPGLVVSNRDIASMLSGAGRQMVVENHFSIQAPGGRVSRQTEAQVAAAAARGVLNANRRNN